MLIFFQHFKDFATFTYPIQPALCMFFVFVTAQKYRKGFNSIKGLFYKVNRRIFIFPKCHLVAYNTVEISTSVLVDVSLFPHQSRCLLNIFCFILKFNLNSDPRINIRILFDHGGSVQRAKTVFWNRKSNWRTCKWNKCELNLVKILLYVNIFKINFIRKRRILSECLWTWRSSLGKDFFDRLTYCVLWFLLVFFDIESNRKRFFRSFMKMKMYKIAWEKWERQQQKKNNFCFHQLISSNKLHFRKYFSISQFS